MEEWEGVGEGQIERSTSRQAAVNSVNHHTMDTNSNGTSFTVFKMLKGLSFAMEVLHSEFNPVKS